MKLFYLGRFTATVVIVTASIVVQDDSYGQNGGKVELGPRPYYLIDKMQDGEVKSKLQQCTEHPSKVTDFSIGHRGAALQFPEHTKESYEAAARMGAGIVECDVTFTDDLELVCRHSQCDLHTTTNILVTDLADKCTEPFTPAEFDGDGKLIKEASAKCCTSDLTLDEFKLLCGKMDAGNKRAQTAEAYVVGGTATWRTDLYSTFPYSLDTINVDDVCTGTLLSHKESIAYIGELGRKYTPELKEASVEMPYVSTSTGETYTQENYAQQMVDEYKAAEVPPENVWVQSFHLEDVLYWIKNEPAFGEQAVYLDDADNVSELPTKEELMSYAEMGVNIVAPPLYSLVKLDSDGTKIEPSDYAKNATEAGLDIIAWSFERSPPVQQMKDGTGDDWYFQTVIDGEALTEDGDIYNVLDVILQDVGAIGVFSDWPASVTYYANCLKDQ